MLAALRRTLTIPIMTATLTAPVESLLREQVAKGHFPNMDRALEAAVKTDFGRRASPALELLLDEALAHPAEHIPLSQLRQQAA
jgi:Arc/MetJ-type ribon-helix-helix transcriptional regulator